MCGPPRALQGGGCVGPPASRACHVDQGLRYRVPPSSVFMWWAGSLADAMCDKGNRTGVDAAYGGAGRDACRLGRGGCPLHPRQKASRRGRTRKVGHFRRRVGFLARRVVHSGR